MPLELSDFEREALPTLIEYGKIPCLSQAFDQDWQRSGHLERAIRLYAEWARGRNFANFTVEIHHLEGATPVLVVTIDATSASSTGTVLLYGHLDKQPPLGEWSPGLQPFDPVRRGDQLFARGVADDGYAMFASLLAVESLERERIPHARCVVLIEAGEESGSPDLAKHVHALEAHLGHVELMICLDSGALTYDRLWVTTSLRGVLNANVTVKVLKRGQHSGAASGVVPSSFRIMRLLLDRIEDATTGEVLLSSLRTTIPETHVNSADQLAAEFGDVSSENFPVVDGLELMGAPGADRELRLTWRPTLSVVGVAGMPDVAIAGNVLRTETTLTLSLRLPPNADAKAAERELRDVLTTDVPHHAHVTVSEVQTANGWATPPLAPWLADALAESSHVAFGKPVGFAGEGGSIPFLATLGEMFPDVQFVATGVLGPNSNAHGIDEMLDLPTAVAVTNAMSHVIAAHARK